MKQVGVRMRVNRWLLGGMQCVDRPPIARDFGVFERAPQAPCRCTDACAFTRNELKNATFPTYLSPKLSGSCKKPSIIADWSLRKSAAPFNTNPARRIHLSRPPEQWMKKTMISMALLSPLRKPRRNQRKRRMHPVETNPWTRAQTQATMTMTATRYGRSTKRNTALANETAGTRIHYRQASDRAKSSSVCFPLPVSRLRILTALQCITTPRIQSHKDRGTTTINLHTATSLRTASPPNPRNRAPSLPNIRARLPSPAHLQRRRKRNAHLPALEQTPTPCRP